MLAVGGGVRKSSAEGMLTFLAGSCLLNLGIHTQIIIQPMIFHENILATAFSNSALNLYQKHKFRMVLAFQW